MLRLSKESASPAGELPARAHADVQDLSAPADAGDQREIALLTDVDQSTDALLVRAIGLAQGGVDISIVSGLAPGPIAHFPGAFWSDPGYGVELPYVVPSKWAQESSQGGRGLDLKAQNAGGIA